jgi:hypothetical protein
MRHFLFLLFVMLLLTSCDQKKPNDFISGTWHMAQGDQRMRFYDDSLLLWMMPGNLQMDSFFATYRLSVLDKSGTIDLFDFDKGILKGKILAGIFERKGEDTLLLDFEPADLWMETDSLRPKSMNPTQMRQLIRQE